MKQATIFLADDHSMLLEALRVLLEPTYKIVGTATDGVQMLAKATKLQPDVVVMDITMPRLNGLNAAVKLRKKLPDVKIVFLTMNEDPELVTEAFRLGADGYLLKSSASSELFDAIEAVLNSKSYVTSEITRGMINSFIKSSDGEKTDGSLTSRQRVILQLLAEGHTMKRIAYMLSITERTVSFHKYQLMDKLGIKSNSELVRYAVKLGLVT